jgi:hypothetical protein
MGVVVAANDKGERKYAYCDEKGELRLMSREDALNHKDLVVFNFVQVAQKLLPLLQKRFPGLSFQLLADSALV